MSEPRTWEVDGATVAVRSWPGEAPAVVLVHGAGGNHDTLGRLGAALSARGIAAHAPSLPGRCGSDGPPKASVAEAADWMARLIAALDLPHPPVVLGHSLGGAICIELALRHPTSVAGIVLVSTGAKLRVHPDILALMAQAAESGVPAEAGQMAWRPDADPARIEEAAAIGRRTPPATTLIDWRAADVFDRMVDLGRIAVPTLVLGGSADVLTPPKYAHFLAQGLSRAHEVAIEGGGHMLPIEMPEEVATEVARFRAALKASPEA